MNTYRFTYTERGCGSTRFQHTVKARWQRQAVELFDAVNSNRRIVRIVLVQS